MDMITVSDPDTISGKPCSATEECFLELGCPFHGKGPCESLGVPARSVCTGVSWNEKWTAQTNTGLIVWLATCRLTTQTPMVGLASEIVSIIGYLI